MENDLSALFNEQRIDKKYTLIEESTPNYIWDWMKFSIPWFQDYNIGTMIKDEDAATLDKLIRTIHEDQKFQTSRIHGIPDFDTETKEWQDIGNIAYDTLIQFKAPSDLRLRRKNFTKNFYKDLI